VGFFVLSLKAGGTGLNLTAASHVVHFDRWWNPPSRTRPRTAPTALVRTKMCWCTSSSVRNGREKIDTMIESKRQLRRICWKRSRPTADRDEDDELLKLVALDLNTALKEILDHVRRLG